MRACEFIGEDYSTAHLKATKDFGVRPDEKLARAVAYRNFLATEKFLAQAHRRWARLLIAAGRTHPPIPAGTQHLSVPQNPTASTARYIHSGVALKPASAL